MSHTAFIYLPDAATARTQDAVTTTHAVIPEPAAGLTARCRRLVAAPAFERTVVGLILLNAVVLGLETTPSMEARWGGVLDRIDAALLAAFCVELVLRVAACWPRLGAFFRNGWNVFDAAVVLAALLPAIGPTAGVARLARVLRVARLVSTVPELRIVVGTMLRSIPALSHVLLLLGLLIYVYGVLGVQLFREADPAHWGSLPIAFGTLFQILTLEGWVEVQARSAHPFAPLFYGSFIVLAVFVVTNLFIAVVLSNLEQVRREEPGDGDADVRAEVETLRAGIDRLARRLGA
jgi:voltage-gated sodium channel